MITIYNYHSYLLCYYLFLTKQPELIYFTANSDYHCTVFSHSVVSDSLWPPWTLARQAPLSMEILQARILEWMPYPPPGDRPNPGIKPRPSALQADSLPSELPGKSIISWLIGKDLDAEKDWRQEKGATQDELVGWHHWLNGHKSEQTQGESERQGSLVRCSPCGCRVRYNLMIEKQQLSMYVYLSTYL